MNLLKVLFDVIKSIGMKGIGFDDDDDDDDIY
jgi:hypothetical protein